MDSENLIRQFIRESIASRLIYLSDGTETGYGSDDHINEYDRLISDLQHTKSSLKTRKNKENRKESSRLQSAIEAVRYLKRKAQRSRAKEDLLV